MNLKEKLKNILMLKNNKKIIVVLIVIMLMGVVGTVILNDNGRKMRQELKEKEKFQQLALKYNESIKEYNDIVKEFNTLAGEATKDEPEKKFVVEVKPLYSESYEKFRDNGSDFLGLSKSVSEEAKNVSLLKEQYGQLCLSTYNNAVDYYNESAGRYNDLVQTILKHKIDTVSDNIPIMERADASNEEFYSKYKHAQTLIDDINTCESKQREIADKQKNIRYEAYISVVNDFNIIAEEYNNMVQESSVEFIKNMPKQEKIKNSMGKDEADAIDDKQLFGNVELVQKDTERVVGNYIVVKQITCPEAVWIKNRLGEVKGIKTRQEVTKSNDPNGLLNKDGGYKGCVYFTYDKIKQEEIPGETTIEKGTDAGGAIEIFKNKNDALNRCDYLSQFDGTLLYSGSYAIAGTMVIRTSYKLSDKQQTELTNSILEKITEIK